MLYQTPYPLLFHFHPFPSSSTTTAIPPPPPPLTLSPSSPLPPSPQAETEMECVETALKTSLRKDMTTVKLSPQTQTFVDEEVMSNAQQNGTSCDDFFVDDLLDFSHVVEEQDSAELLLQHPNPNKQQQDSTSVFSLQQHNHSHEICNELNVPTEDAADLEWLSHFVEDSFTEFSVALPPVNPKNSLKPEPVFTQPCFKTPVQTKARSKRTRTSVRVWPFGSTSFTTDSSTSSTTSSSSSSSPTSPLLICLDQLCFPAAKKPTKKPSSKPAAVVQVPPRRCTHCGVQKTPQWRTGPLGAKTLCNACGVRFKSGRLLPEYRPACSPTFSTELHSNHHRKVLEMRRKKEVTTSEVEIEIDNEPGLAPASSVVPSF